MGDTNKLAGCKPDLVRKVQAVIRDVKAHGYTLIVVEGLRSKEQAAINWAKGRKKLRSGEWVIVDPKAVITKTQHSRHCDGEAADLAPIDDSGNIIWNTKNPAWTYLGRAAAAHGLIWGGEWKMRDLGHVELPE